MSYSLQYHEPQHTRPPCPSPTPRVHPNPCPLSWWCHPTISSSVIPFSSCPQSFPALGSFPVSQLFASGGQVLEFQLQHQSFQRTFRIDFLYDGVVGSPCRPKDSQEPSPTPQFKSINSLVLTFLYSPTLTPIHDYWRNHRLDWQTFVGKVMSVLFNMLSSLVIIFLPRSKCLLFQGCGHHSQWFWSPRK